MKKNLTKNVNTNVLCELNVCSHSGWPRIGWNVVATFVSQKAVSQAGLYLIRGVTATKINDTTEPILNRPTLIN